MLLFQAPTQNAMGSDLVDPRIEATGVDFLMSQRPPSPRRRPKAKPKPARKRQGSVTRLPRVTSTEINTVLSDAHQEIWGLDRIHQFVSTKVEDVLAARQVPRQSVQAPSLDIAVPAIEAMRYCQFRSEMTALIASAMDRRLSHQAHPAFVNILRQLAPDELRILSLMPPQEEVLPLGNLHLVLSEGRTRIIYRSIVPKHIADACKAKQAIPTYIDNLDRLKLITSPDTLSIRDEAVYADLMQQEFCFDLRNALPKRARPRLERRTLALTALGENFRTVCLS